jgi:hypothetical protein
MSRALRGNYPAYSEKNGRTDDHQKERTFIFRQLDLEEGRVLILRRHGSAVDNEKKDRQEKGFLKRS